MPEKRVRSKRGAGPSRSQQRSRPSRPSGPRGGDRAGPSRSQQQQQQRQQEQRQQQSQREQRQEQQQRQQQQRERQQREERASAREQARTRPTRTTQRGGITAVTPKKDKQNILSRIKTSIMGGGVGGDPTIDTKEFAKTQPVGQHKLRTQYERLKAKYGPGWEGTTQAQELVNYLKGVPVTRGGGMGARDPGYGGGAIPTGPAEAARQRILEEMSTRAGRPGGGGISALKGMDPKFLRQGLTGDQYFNFRQQLMQSDPSAYEKAFPWSSGKGVRGLMKFAPGIGTAARLAKGAFGKAQEGTMGLKSGILSLFNRAQGAVSPAGGQAVSSGDFSSYGTEQFPQAGQTWSGIYDRLISEQGMTDAQAKQRMAEMSQSGSAQTFGPVPPEFSLDFQEASLPSQGVIGGMNQPIGQGQVAPSALTPGGAFAMSPMTQQLRFQQPNWQQWNQNVGRFPGIR